MRLPLLTLVPLARGAAVPTGDPCDNLPYLVEFYQNANFTGNSTAGAKPNTVGHCLRVPEGVSSIQLVSWEQCNLVCGFFRDPTCTHKPDGDIILKNSVFQLPKNLDNQLQSHMCFTGLPKGKAQPDNIFDQDTADHGVTESDQPASQVSERATAFPFMLTMYSDPDYTGTETWTGGLSRCVTGSEIPEGVSSIKYPPTDGPNQGYRGTRCFLYDNDKCTFGPGHVVSIEKSTPDLGSDGIMFDNKLKSFQCFLPEGHEDPDRTAEISTIIDERGEQPAEDYENSDSDAASTNSDLAQPAGPTTQYLLRLYKDANYTGEPLLSGKPGKINECTPTVSGISSVQFIHQADNRKFHCYLFDNTQCKGGDMARVLATESQADLNVRGFDDRTRAHYCEWGSAKEASADIASYPVAREESKFAHTKILKAYLGANYTGIRIAVGDWKHLDRCEQLSLHDIQSISFFGELPWEITCWLYDDASCSTEQFSFSQDVPDLKKDGKNITVGALKCGYPKKAAKTTHALRPTTLP